MPCRNARYIARSLVVRAVLGSILVATPALAETRFNRDEIAVSARVVAVARLTPVDVPPALRLTAIDIARGYTDVAASYELFANARNGYRLRMAIEGDAVASVEAARSGTVYNFGRSGGELVEQPGRVIRERLVLELRLQLRPGLSPGDIDWPIRIGAEPL